MNVTAVIVVRGTAKSERAGGLDAGEVSSFTIEPGQFDSNISSPGDLIEQVDRSAYLRGEWISSLRIDHFDVIEKIIEETLQEFRDDEETVMQALTEMGLFCNADTEDLRALVNHVMSKKHIN